MLDMQTASHHNALAVAINGFFAIANTVTSKSRDVTIEATTGMQAAASD